jgi:hypothetical protein
MSNDWIVYGLGASVFLLMWRLDRLGKQLEAVCAIIRIDLAPSEARRGKFLTERKQAREDAAKEQRQQWIGAGIVGALLLGWYIITRN